MFSLLEFNLWKGGTYTTYHGVGDGKLSIDIFFYFLFFLRTGFDLL